MTCQLHIRELKGGIKNERTGRKSEIGERSLHWHRSRISRPSNYPVALAFEIMDSLPGNWPSEEELSKSGAGIVEVISGTNAVRIVYAVLVQSLHYKLYFVASNRFAFEHRIVSI